MFRLLIASVLALFFLGVNPAEAREPMCKRVDFLLSPYLTQIMTAQLMVKDNFPQWYQKNVCIRVEPDNRRSIYGYVMKDPNTKELYMGIVRSGLDLKRTEDLAHVLLHEYVHVALWAKERTPCTRAREELLAYNINIEARSQIESSILLHAGFTLSYRGIYMDAMEKCPAEIYEDLPYPDRDR